MGNASQVVLFKEYVAVPVFHLARFVEHPRSEERVELDDGWTRVTERHLTACGLTISEWGWEEAPNARSLPWDQRHRNQRSGSWPLTLRRDHAEAFARLCARCEAAS